MPDDPLTTPTLVTAPRAAGDLPVIEDPALLALADRVIGAVQMAANRGLAHIEHPQQFTLPTETDSIERIVHQYAMNRPAQARHAAVARAVRALTSVSAEQQGDLDRIDLQSREPVAAQFTRLDLPQSMLRELSQLTRVTVRAHRLMAERATIPQVVRGSGLNVRVPPGAAPRPDDLKKLGTFISRKWEALGGREGFLGEPKGPEVTCGDGTGVVQHFANGSIYWTPKTRARAIYGAIRDKWLSLGAEGGFLGYPTSDELPTGDGRGRFSRFQGGVIYWTEQSGAHEMHGAILEKWGQLGAHSGFLGYPTSDETIIAENPAIRSDFQGGSVYWTPATGAWAVERRVRDAWSQHGGERSPLGYPLSDTAGVGTSRMVNQFQGGRIEWEDGRGAHVVHTMTKLQLRLHSIRCVEETGADWAGSDEIDVGGVATDAALGSSLISRFRAGDFDSGQTKTFSPPHVIHTFNLLEHAWWPKAFLVTLTLAEIESGGFNDVLRKLLEQIRQMVEKEVTKYAIAAGAAVVGYIAGAAVGAVAGPIIGLLVGFIVAAFFDWLFRQFDDQVFVPVPVPIDIPSVHQRWGAAADTPEWFYSVSRPGGRYEINGDWALVP